MNPYRRHIIIQTLALLPSKRMICPAARAAHRQQGSCPPPGGSSSSTDTWAASRP